MAAYNLNSGTVNKILTQINEDYMLGENITEKYLEKIIAKYNCSSDVTERIYEFLNDKNIEIEIEDDELSAKSGEKTSSDTENLYKLYIQDISRYKLLTAEEETELAVRIQNGDQKAKEIFINSNLRLVVDIAKRETKFDKGSLLDAIQAGNLGLIKAVDRFSGEKGTRFSTYGSFWITQAIRRNREMNSRNIRLPSHVYESMTLVNKFRRKYYAENGIEPTVQQISNYTEFSADKVIEYLGYLQDTVSLSKPLGDEDEGFLSDTVADKSSPAPNTKCEKTELEQKLRASFRHLSEREKVAVILRFGLEDGKMWTLEAIGKNLGVSRERVRQILNKALIKLRTKAGSELIDYLGD